MRDDVSRFGECNGFTQLVWPLNGEDPDDAFSSVPYEKVRHCVFVFDLVLLLMCCDVGDEDKQNSFFDLP